MSSTTYSTDLRPDARSRDIVLGTGAAACIGGLAALVPLPVDSASKLVAMAAWLAVGSRDLWLIAAGHKLCRRIELHHDGGVRITTPDGRCIVATLGSGSVVTRGFAWLRIGVPGGRQCRVLLRRKATNFKDWRRLQVIWRHLGAGG